MYVKTGISASEILKIQRTFYGEAAIKMSRVFEWLEWQRFKKGEDMKDGGGFGYLKTHQTYENVEKVYTLLFAKQRRTFAEHLARSPSQCNCNGNY